LNVIQPVHDRTSDLFGELFGQFASMTSHIFWVYDLYPEEHVVYASPSFERVFGRKPQELYARHGLWMDSIHPEDRAATAAAYERWLNGTTDETYVLEFRILRPDGEVRWIFDHGRRICDPSGRTVRVIGIAEDHTARKQAEAALRSSEQSFRQLADSLPQMIFTATPEGICDFVNRRWGEYSGRTDEHLLGLKWSECIHPGDVDSLVSRWLECVATKTAYQGEHRIRGRDGTYRWFTSRVAPVFAPDGRLVRWCGSNTDIHEEHQLRERLRAERDRLTTISTTAPGVLHSFRLTPDGHASFPYASPTIRDIYGFSAEDLKEDASVVMTRVHPEDLQRIRESVLYSQRTLTPWRAEYRVLHPERGEIWVEIYSVPRREEDGAVVWHGYIMDVSTRKRSDALQLRSQKMEALGTLAGGIAHDFNNILLAITGNTRLAIADLPPDSPALVSLTEVERAGLRATELVRQILSFSHQREPQRKVTALQPIVEEALKLLRSTLPAMIRIVTWFEPGVPPVAVDATQIHQIMMNLATNAAHAIGDAAGTIEVSIDNVVIGPDEITTSPDLREGRYARLSISDNGSGMHRATLERIFDPFFTTKPAGQGTGLGLSVVHGIVRAHQGAVTVYSQPEKGSTFRVYFPVAVASAQQQDAPRLQAVSGRGERIMYVDDEESLVFLGERVLERMGYKVSGYSDPARALKDFTARPHDFDVVVTDLSMPGMSGFHLAQALLQSRPDLPIIMTTGYVRPEDRETAERRGIRELILKPNSIEELGRTLDRLFRQLRADT
jgi:PAS domain S-box-containing protein